MNGSKNKKSNFTFKNLQKLIDENDDLLTQCRNIKSSYDFRNVKDEDKERECDELMDRRAKHFPVIEKYKKECVSFLIDELEKGNKIEYRLFQELYLYDFYATEKFNNAISHLLKDKFSARNKKFLENNLQEYLELLKKFYLLKNEIASLNKKNYSDFYDLFIEKNITEIQQEDESYDEDEEYDWEHLPLKGIYGELSDGLQKRIEETIEKLDDGSEEFGYIKMLIHHATFEPIN